MTFSDRTGTPSRGADAVSLGVAVMVPVVAGALVGLTTRPGPDWYEGLAKPPWNPPSAVFGPVWTTLYAAMGVASWLVWRRWRRPEGGSESNGAAAALSLYAVQLAVNLGWSPVFFGMQRVGGALVVILVLWGLIIATIDRFRRLSGTAALLLVPYLLWVTFATALNGSIWWQNR